MTARAGKHEHNFRIISHYYDWTKVLVMCGPIGCIETQVWTQQTKKVKVGPRRYAPMPDTEWKELIQSMEHLCCVS